MEIIRQEIIKYREIRGVTIADHDLPSRFASHWHTSAELLLAKKDGVVLVCNDIRYELKEGDIFIAWPRDIHEIIDIPADSALQLQFVPGLIENNLDLISVSSFLRSLHHIEHETDGELADRIASKILKIKEFYRNRIYFSESHCKTLIFDILVELGEYAVSTSRRDLPSAIYSDADRRHIQAALVYIDEHFADSISQTDVAQYIGLSQYYFSRMFKKYMQKNLPAYISEVRIRHAIGLLSDKELSITDCAYRSGFQSITAFNKVFKEIIGCSPREYRKLKINSNQIP